MGDEREEKNPVSTGVSLFKVLLIIVLIIIVGLLFYVYKHENEVYNDDDYFPSTEETDFYYKGIPERVDDENEMTEEFYKDEKYSSTSRTFDYSEDDGFYDDDYYTEEEEKQVIEKFNTSLKNNLVLTKVIKSVEDKDYVILEITNNNAEAVDDFYIDLAFYGADNKLLGVCDEQVEYIKANSVTYVEADIGNINFARYEYSFKKERALRELTECEKDIQYEISEDESETYYIVNVRNISNHDVRFIFQAKYYDATGNVIYVQSENSDVSPKKETEKGLFKNTVDDEEEYDSSTDEIYFSKYLSAYDTYDEIKYAKCEITLYVAVEG